MTDAVQDASIQQARIGAMLLAAPTYAAHEWGSAALVARFDQGRWPSVSGYLYLRDGSAVAALPDHSTLDALAEALVALAAAGERPDGRRWLAALVQVIRDRQEVRITLEWDDPERWRVTPANVDTLPGTLAPESR